MSNETPVTIVGNLTADPELRYTQAGKAVANFTVASTPKFFDKQSNQWKDGEALFMRCAVWAEFAEHVSGSLTKGARVIVQGTLQQRSFETREGEKRTAIELKVEALGPDLRYATAQVTRAQSNRQGAPQTAQADVWAQPQQTTEEWAQSGGYADDTSF
ncbi:single-stranded DNA-binding protein [Paramicrobacterium chengjingii]|uniref:single-stranded DNA-binding protein n=1 Tax=Paramicrobacterium chengjingii TaxID=2769067 RepID=UPI00142184C6|nr:single-stranded DNA-binding protein [Microbacterium chengjingii]